MNPISWHYSPAIIEDALAAWLPAPVEGDERGLAILSNAMRYAALSGGKRTRPLLLLESAFAVCNGECDIKPALDAAVRYRNDSRVFVDSRRSARDGRCADAARARDLSYRDRRRDGDFWRATRCKLWRWKRWRARVICRSLTLVARAAGAAGMAGGAGDGHRLDALGRR